MTPPADILGFWFGDGPTDRYDRVRSRALWFAGTPAVDALIRRRFLADVEGAAAGDYDGWQARPADALALILLLDQFPLNIFRGEARGYRLGERAVPLARAALDRGDAAHWNLNQQVFGLMPLVHSEDPGDQERAVAGFAALRARPGMQGSYDAACRQRALIRRFGRFPWRNDALGRASTPDELDWLARRPSAAGGR